jgi:hypothetical protein
VGNPVSIAVLGDPAFVPLSNAVSILLPVGVLASTPLGDTMHVVFSLLFDLLGCEGSCDR